MTETLWLAGMLFANLWAAGALDANNTEKDALQGAAAGSVPGSVLTRGDQDQQQKAIALANARAVLAASGSLNAQVDASRVLTLNPAFLNAEEQPAKSGDLRTTILPAIKHGEQAHCEQPPTQQEILSALPTLARGVPYVYEQYRDEVEFTVEKLVDRVDAPRWFPLIGPAQLHHCTWKCTVYYTDVIEIANPVPFTTRTKHTEVVFIDRDHLHLYGEQQNEGVSEQPQSCPGGHFRPTPKDIVKAEKPEPVQQVLLEITVASIDRAAVPDATYRWAMKQLGLTGDNVGFSVPKNRDAADDFVQALQNDGFVKPLEMRRVNTVSGRPARILSGYGGNTQTIASGAGSTYQLNLDLGTAVNLLPVAMANGKIHLEVAAEMNTVNTASLPILKRRANAASEMEDGQTIVIGGLTYTETTETDNSVPFLNELPYVGALFTSKEQQQTKRDLLILVTARLTPSVGSAEETSEPPLSSITPEATPFPTAAYKSEYAAAPADIVTIESRRFVPKAPYRLEPMDVLQIDAAEPIRGMYMITPEGNISLGESYRPIPVAGLTVAEAQRAIWDYLTQHPDLKDVSAFANVSLAQARGLQNISGEHLVRPDGTISLGMFGAVHVSGMTPV